MSGGRGSTCNLHWIDLRLCTAPGNRCTTCRRTASAASTARNPTSPLGVGGLDSFFFQPPSSPSGRGLPLPLPPPLDLGGWVRDGLERPRWPKMAPRASQRAQDELQDGSRSPRWLKMASNMLRKVPRPPQDSSKWPRSLQRTGISPIRYPRAQCSSKMVL